MPSGNYRRAVGIVSRAPTPGNVKSRLGAELGAEVASELYAAFLRDVLVNAAALPNTSVSIFHPADNPPDAIASLCPPGVTIQPESGLGYREVLPSSLRRMLENAPVASLVGADSPGLPGAIIAQAFESIESGSADVAIGPASDGGYYLLAVNGDYPGLFRDIEWGTETVFDQTMHRASESRLRVAVLPVWYDVDRLDDVARLADDLAGDVSLGAAATRSTLQRLSQAGHPVPTGSRAWPIREQRSIYRSRWRSLVCDDVETHHGERIEYAYLETDPAVWVVPVTPEGRIILIRQYRHPIGEMIVEVPAGSGDEEPEVIARRELAEEIGGSAGRFVHVASYFPASAHLAHKGHVYVAFNVERGESDLESTELLAPFSVPLDLAIDMARRGEIADSQSALALLAAEPLIRARLELL